MKKEKIIAMIPVRLKSQRIKYKNLRLLAGKPLMAYAIDSALKSGIFDKVVVNSEVPEIQQIAERYGAEFYLRDEQFASSTTNSDDVVLDFIDNNYCDIVYWVNPTSPLQSPVELRESLGYFRTNKLDSMLTCIDHQVHSLYQNKPVNFVEDEKFARTQDLDPVQTCVFSFMAWRSSAFRGSMSERNYAFLNGNVGYYQVSKLSSIDIDHEEDFAIADYIIRARKSEKKPEYDDLYYKLYAETETVGV